jgi:hypothetical protein
MMLLAACLLLCPISTVRAEADADTDHAQKKTITMLTPPSNFYPVYIADPVRPQSAIKLLYFPNSEISDAGPGRLSLHLGGRFGLVRWHPEDEPERGWQLDFEGGFFGQFDLQGGLDNIGWDGLFGIYASWLPNRDTGFRIGMSHDSAHVGDEYAESTGRKRVNYTREEITAGFSRRLASRWQVYADGGYSYILEEFQEAWRLEAGVQYFGARRFWNERMSWYGALDLQSFEENAWQVRYTAQLGLILPTGRGTSRYRIAAEAGTGRSVMGEFFFRDETYVGIGWYFDF